MKRRKNSGEERPVRHPKLHRGIEKLRRCRIYLLLFFCILVGLDFLLRWVYQGAANIELFDKTPVLFTLCWSLLVTAVAFLLPRVVKQIFMMGIVLLDCVLFLVHAGMFSFFHRFFSFSDIAFAGDGAEFFELSYFHFRKIIFIGLFLAIVGGVLACVLVPRREKYSRTRVICGVLLLVLSVGGVFGVKKLSFKRDASVNWNNYEFREAIYENFTDSTRCLMLTGLHHYTFRDFCLTYRVYDLFSNGDKKEELDAYYASIEPDPDNEMTGIFKGKNLIMIQLEAIDTWLINETCMPNLLAVQEQSLDFTNNFAPMYLAAGTFNTENLANTGMVSPAVGGSITMYSRNAYPLSAAHLFEQEGYTANSFHGSPGTVYDREVIHKNWGYLKYHGYQQMHLQDYSYDSQLMDAFELFTSHDHPFFSFIITISGHGPYKDSKVSNTWYDKFAAILPEGTDEMVIHAYAHAYETDLFIGALMERLEAEGFLDNTVLVFYADHYDYYVVDDQIIMQQKNVTDSNMIQSTPFFIYSKDTAPQKITKVTSTVDILPTVVNLFDLNTDGRYYMGNDAFSDNGGYVIFADTSWYDGTTYWRAGIDPADTQEIVDRNLEVQDRMNMSKNALLVNYFADCELLGCK